ncbi:nickel pincer cofactor biosynthesis protein LarB [Prolixibacteraceae bacterium JC049]|nr:nickel pincer cofactor biosynthesis protein LarB [Prolixibacteraceae bacterium JC049]
MDDKYLKTLLQQVAQGEMNTDEAMTQLQKLPFQDLGHTKVDFHRALRNGFPEVIYAEGKNTDQVVDIFKAMYEKHNVLATRVTTEMADAVCKLYSDVEYNPLAKTLAYKLNHEYHSDHHVTIVTAGTSDLPVAEEARVTCDILGNKTKLISDVGVAGIHRLFDQLDEIRKASVIIVVAGMEGALSSVIGGLVQQPVIAVPTSIGYGANLQGISALLGMLTSCASGITVVNIDNGFGAACAAHKIIKQFT